MLEDEQLESNEDEEGSSEGDEMEDDENDGIEENGDAMSDITGADQLEANDDDLPVPNKVCSKNLFRSNSLLERKKAEIIYWRRANCKPSSQSTAKEAIKTTEKIKEENKYCYGRWWTPTTY